MQVDAQVEVDGAEFNDRGIQKIYYRNEVRLADNARDSILKVDYIVVSPGNYYSSVIPNLIVSGFREAIAQSTAKLIFPVNLTNKHEHTKNWKVSTFVKNIEMYLGKQVDYILVNTEAPSPEQIERYKLQEGDGVLVEDDMNDPRVVHDSLISHMFYSYNKADARQSIRSFIRHDSEKIAKCIDGIIKK